MNAIIAHWGGKEPPVPEAVRHIDGNRTTNPTVYYTVEIDDLAAFIEKHGSMIVVPPGKSPYPFTWFIWYNGGSSQFRQS